MNNETIKPYIQIEDSDGAVASVYFMNDTEHEIHYNDKSGKKFYTEKFFMMPIEIVEKYAMEWVKGKRELVS